MRILIVEDQTELREFLQVTLESECFAVDSTGDGETGSTLATTNEYDLLILDNNLPHKNGSEICVMVRKMKKNIPILMLSVESDTQKKVDLLNLGADDYMTKPFSFEELTARIRALMRRGPALREEILKVGDLSIDTKKHIVRRANKEIRLTRKEFMLLEYLIRNEGNVISRGTLLEHVWDLDVDVFSNTLEMHIASLRKKVDFEFATKLIHTIIGRGYKLGLQK